MGRAYVARVHPTTAITNCSTSKYRIRNVTIRSNHLPITKYSSLGTQSRSLPTWRSLQSNRSSHQRSDSSQRSLGHVETASRNHHSESHSPTTSTSPIDTNVLYWIWWIHHFYFILGRCRRNRRMGRPTCGSSRNGSGSRTKITRASHSSHSRKKETRQDSAGRSRFSRYVAWIHHSRFSSRKYSILKIWSFS